MAEKPFTYANFIIKQRAKKRFFAAIIMFFAGISGFFEGFSAFFLIFAFLFFVMSVRRIKNDTIKVHNILTNAKKKYYEKRATYKAVVTSIIETQKNYKNKHSDKKRISDILKEKMDDRREKVLQNLLEPPALPQKKAASMASKLDSISTKSL